MCRANNEKRKTTNDERNRTTKLRKIKTLGEKDNLQLLEKQHRHYKDKQNNKTRKQKWEEKQLYGYFKRQTSEILHIENMEIAKKRKT